MNIFIEDDYQDDEFECNGAIVLSTGNNVEGNYSDYSEYHISPTDRVNLFLRHLSLFMENSPEEVDTFLRTISECFTKQQLRFMISRIKEEERDKKEINKE